MARKRGKYNIDPITARNRSRKNSRNSPWRLGPVVKSENARRTWAKICEDRRQEQTTCNKSTTDTGTTASPTPER